MPSVYLLVASVKKSLCVHYKTEDKEKKCFSRQDVINNSKSACWSANGMQCLCNVQLFHSLYPFKSFKSELLPSECQLHPASGLRKMNFIKSRKCTKSIRLNTETRAILQSIAYIYWILWLLIFTWTGHIIRLNIMCQGG